MRFDMSFTNDYQETYPDGVVEEPYVRRNRLENRFELPFTDAQRAAWLARGESYDMDPDGVPVTIDHDVHHWIEFATLDDLLAFVRQRGRVVIDIENGNYTLEVYNDYRE